MKVSIVDRAGFVYIAELVPVASPPGLFHFRLATVYRHAKVPEAEHIKASVLLDRAGIVALRELLDHAIGQIEAPEGAQQVYDSIGG